MEDMKDMEEETAPSIWWSMRTWISEDQTQQGAGVKNRSLLCLCEFEIAHLQTRLLANRWKRYGNIMKTTSNNSSHPPVRDFLQHWPRRSWGRFMILGIRGGTHPMSASSAGDEPGHLNQVDTSKQELLDAILIILSYLVIFSNIVSYFVIFVHTLSMGLGVSSRSWMISRRFRRKAISQLSFKTGEDEAQRWWNHSGTGTAAQGPVLVLGKEVMYWHLLVS